VVRVILRKAAGCFSAEKWVITPLDLEINQSELCFMFLSG
jgi:hypothetical protein